MMAYPRILIIGAGIIGASIGYHLAKAGAAPLMVDAGTGAGEATSASWGWLNATWGNSDSYALLRRQSLRLWRQLKSEIPELPVRFCGSLTYDLSDADLVTFAREMATADYPIEIVGPAEIRAREPNLLAVPGQAALCLAEGVAEPSRSAFVLRQRAIALGARFQPDTRVLRVLAGGEVETSRGSLAADILVCCAGIGTSPLLADLGFALPINAPEGLMIHSQPVSPILTGLLITPGMELRQTDQGRLVAAVAPAGHGDVATQADTILSRINTTLRLPAPARLAFTTLGKRPVPQDGLPAIGFVPGAPGVYVAVMHSGITLAAVAGAFAAGEILGQSPHPLFETYRPGRFTGSRSNLHDACTP